MELKLKPVDVSNCTDKELIELAAVSIGYQKILSWKDDVYSSYSGEIFNPLMDWNSAMFLVTQLGLNCSTGTNTSAEDQDLYVASADLATGAEYVIGDCSYCVYTMIEYSKSNGECDTALRRAITTFAAKIGKIMLETYGTV